MVNLTAINKNKCNELYDKLNYVASLIAEIKNILDEEIKNSDINLVYNSNLNYQNFKFQGLTYNQINNVVEHMKRTANYENNLEIDKIRDLIKDWFCDMLLEDVYFSNEPKSYLLASKIDELTFELGSVDEKYYFIDERLLGLFSRENLISLELVILKDLYEVKRKLNEINKKLNLLKADSEYIKRLKSRVIK